MVPKTATKEVKLLRGCFPNILVTMAASVNKIKQDPDDVMHEQEMCFPHIMSSLKWKFFLRKKTYYIT